MKMGILDGDVNHSNTAMVGAYYNGEHLIAILFKREIKFSIRIVRSRYGYNNRFNKLGQGQFLNYQIKF